MDGADAPVAVGIVVALAGKGKMGVVGRQVEGPTGMVS